jgi:hypothetical protein
MNWYCDPWNVGSTSVCSCESTNATRSAKTRPRISGAEPSRPTARQMMTSTAAHSSRPGTPSSEPTTSQ